MKKSILLFVCLMIMANAFSAPGQFVLKGKIQGVASGTAILSYSVFKVDRWHQLIDSAQIILGNFLIKGKIDEPLKAELKFGDKTASFYIEPATMELYFPTKDLSEFTLKGSKTQGESELFVHNTMELDKLDNQLWKQYPKVNLDTIPEDNPLHKKISDEFESITSKRDSLRKLINKIQIDFIRANPNSFLPVIGREIIGLLYQRADPISAAEARKLFNNLSVTVKHSTYGIRTNNDIKVKENVAVGKLAPDFNTPDKNGKIVKLSGFRGKSYVMLDFWASWCSPCLKGVPHLKQLFARYHDKGLEVICVSVDYKKDKWLSAIDKYDLSSWHHVLSVQNLEQSFQYIENKDDIREKYPLGNGVPQYILIDKTGKIIGKWDFYSEQNEQEQDKMVADIFGK